jgi:hypothetical protein
VDISNPVNALNTVRTAKMSFSVQPFIFSSLVASVVTSAVASAVAATLVGSLAGCASSKDTRFGLEDDSVWEKSQASGDAYGADAMTFRKTMKIRPKNDFRFYYKNCELTDHESFYSKTSYWCSEAP